MKSETKENITRTLAIIVCIVLNLSWMLAVTADALQTNLLRFLQVT